MLKKRIFMAFFILAMLSLVSCSSPQTFESSNLDESKNELEDSSKNPLDDLDSTIREVYLKKSPEKVFSVGWPSDTHAYWTTKQPEEDGTTYQLYILDIITRTEHLIFEKKWKQIITLI